MRLIRLILGLVIVFVLVLGASLFFIPGEKIARVATDELSRRTGRDVEIAGEAKISLWPELGVTVGSLRIANADWSDNGPLFQAKSVTIGVDAAALIGGDIRIKALRAEGPEILLERNRAGLGNWELSAAAPAATGAAPASETATAAPAGGESRLNAFTLDRAEITGAAVFYLDQQSGTELSQRNIDLTLTYPVAGGPAGFDLTLRPNGEPVKLTGEVTDPLAFAAARISAIKASLTAPGGKGSFDGRASLVPEAQGTLSVNVSDSGALARALGRPDPGLQPGLGRDLALDTQLTLTRDGKLALRDGKITSGPNSATLAADLDTSGDRPRLNAQLAAGPLSLAALTGASPAPAGSAAATGWSTAPIDAGALGLADAEVAVTAPSVDLGRTRLGTTRVLITVDRARAVVSLREVQAFGGTLTGELVANNRNGLSVAGDLTASNVALRNALGDLAGITRFTGEASAKVKFLGAGQSMAAIMNSLSGEGSIQTGRGTIEGIDLDRMFRGGDVAGGTTIFDSTALTYAIKDGVLTNNDLLMKLSVIEARGEGLIGLGKQQIDYLFTPVSLQARDGRGIAIPVRIRGPWAGPKISLDVEKAIQLNANEEKKKLEERARQEIGKKLGIEQQEGESTEDAVKRKIEEEATRGILKLLR